MRLLGSRFTYDPKFFHLSISPTVNLTPFPCVIYRTSLVRAAVRDLSVLRPVFREDHLIFLLAAGGRSHQIEVDGLLAKIDLLSNGRLTPRLLVRGLQDKKIKKFLLSQPNAIFRGRKESRFSLLMLLRIRVFLSRLVMQITPRGNKPW
jgi:hypothetical protein